METPNSYDMKRSFKDMDEDDRITEYERLVTAHRDTVEILNAFVKLSSRLGY